MGDYIDLHTHSIYSDGELTPFELIELARKNNVGVLSITDHNIVDAYKYFDYENVDFVKVIPGIELSAEVERGQMHILGYGINPFNEELNEVTGKLKQISINSVSAIFRQLEKDYNIKFSFSEVEKILSASHNIGRPDVAKLLIKHGYASDMSDAFNKYLIDAYNKTREYRKLLTYRECIEVIKVAGGIPVLAHPKTLKLNTKELFSLIEDMIDSGLLGIEVYHSSHSQYEMNLYSNLSDQLRLLVSGGSDYHGPNTKPDIELKYGKDNNLRIKKLSILNYL